MTFPNHLIYLHTVLDLYACIAVALIGLVGAGMVGACVVLAFNKRR